MNTRLKEVPYWDMPQFPSSEPVGDFADEIESHASPGIGTESKTEAAFSQIEAALRDVAFQLGESERGAEKKPLQPTTPMRESVQENGVRKTPAPTRAQGVAAAKNEYARSFHELAHRIDNLEKMADTESLRDEVRGLRQRFVEDSDQFDHTLNESGEKISSLSKTVDHLTRDLAEMQERSKQLGTAIEKNLIRLSESLKNSESQLSDTVKRINEDAENRLSFTNHDIEKVSARLERTEIDREEKHREIKSALIALLEKLSAEKERNKKALAETHASLASALTEMKQGLSISETRIWEIVEGRIAAGERSIEDFKKRLSCIDQTRTERDNAFTEALENLRNEINAEKAHSDGALSDIRNTLTSALASSLTEMKRGLEASEKQIQERLERRLSSSEGTIEKLERELEQAGTEIKDKQLTFSQSIESILIQLSHEKNRNVEALAEVHNLLASSVGEMKKNLDASEKRIEETLESRVVTIETKNAEALAELHDLLASSVGEMKQDLDASEKRIATVETKNVEALAEAHDLLASSVGEMKQNLDASEKRIATVETKNVESLAEVHDLLASSVGEMKQNLDASEKRVEETLRSRFSAFDAKIQTLFQRLEQTEQPGEAGASLFDEMIDSLSHRLEQVEREQLAGETSLSEALGEFERRLERVEQNRESQTLSLSENSGKSANRLEQVEVSGTNNGISVEDAVAALLKAEKAQNEKALGEIRSALAEVKAGSGGATLVQSHSSYSDLGLESPSSSFESMDRAGQEKDRSVSEIIAELADRRNYGEAESTENGADENLAEMHGGSDTLSLGPTSFESPEDSELSIAPSVESHASDELKSEEIEREEDVSAPEDYLAGARRAAAEAAEASHTRQSPMQSLAGHVISPEKEFTLSKRKKYLLMAAIILLVLGASGFVLTLSPMRPADNIAAGVIPLTPVAPVMNAAEPAAISGAATETEFTLENNQLVDLARGIDAQALSGPTLSEPQMLATAEATQTETLVSEARAGSSQAALLLGLNYLNGEGVTASDSEAFRWLRVAAEQGEPVAQNRLGALLERGQGVAPNPSEAAFWYEQAARSGNVRAMHNLAIAHSDGAGVEKNLAEAARLFRAAADFGLGDSQFNLAILYSRGMGVPASLGEAYKWYLIAAAQGDNEARMRAEALASELPQDERSAAEVAAAAFVPLSPDIAANTPPDLAQFL